MKYLIISLCCVVSVLQGARAGEVSQRWLHYAEECRQKVQEHDFYRNLHEQTISNQELFIFLNDRIFLFTFFENKLAKFLKESNFPEKFFVRSKAYIEAAGVLAERWVNNDPSREVQGYVEFLENQEIGMVLYHYLLHMAEEVSTIQRLLGKIEKNEKFRAIGKVICQDFGLLRSANGDALIEALADELFPDESLLLRNERMPLVDEKALEQARSFFIFSSSMLDAISDLAEAR